MNEIICEKSTDGELIAAFKDGNVQGFNEIVKRYQKQVYWVVRKMVNIHEDADDITQEVFIKVYKALQDFREEANLFTWLYRIAVNYSLNHINKIRTRQTVSVEDIYIDISDESKTTDEKLEQKVRMKTVYEAINNLPPQQKIVFNMRYYDQLTYEEIAKVLKKSVGGIKANYFHAVKNIGEYTKEKLKSY